MAAISQATCGPSVFDVLYGDAHRRALELGVISSDDDWVNLQQAAASIGRLVGISDHTVLDMLLRDGVPRAL